MIPGTCKIPDRFRRRCWFSGPSCDHPLALIRSGNSVWWLYCESSRWNGCLPAPTPPGKQIPNPPKYTKRSTVIHVYPQIRENQKHGTKRKRKRAADVIHKRALRLANCDALWIRYYILMDIFRPSFRPRFVFVSHTHRDLSLNGI
jgi:hypothetical protein